MIISSPELITRLTNITKPITTTKNNKKKIIITRKIRNRPIQIIDYYY